jgi:hypothetical protein
MLPGVELSQQWFTNPLNANGQMIP